MFGRSGLDVQPAPEVVPNTRLALRLTELARDRGLHERVHDRLMDAYWAEARDIGDADALRGLAAEAGLDGRVDARARRRRVPRPRARVDAAGAVDRRSHGIPAFVLDRRLLVLGAQPEAAFEQAFEQLATAA